MQQTVFFSRHLLQAGLPPFARPAPPPARKRVYAGRSSSKIVLCFLGVILALGISDSTLAEESHDHSYTESEHSADHANGEHGGAHTKHLENWVSLSFGKGKKYHNGPFAFALLNFALLIWLLVKFGKKPFKEYLENRHNTIRDDLAEAARMRSEASEKLNEIQTKLDNLQGEIEAIKDGVAKDAEMEKERIIKAAQEEATRIIEQADKTLENDLKRTRQLLEREAVDAAITAAEKLIKKQINKNDVKRLNEEYFEQIASSGGSN